MKQAFKLFLATLATLFVFVSSYAQVTTSSLEGRVSDKDNEALIGASVVAVHVPTGTKYVAIANDEGRFVINGMRAGGPYKIEVSYIGMSTLEYDNIILKLGDPYEINAVMQTANELAAVTVVSEKSFNASKTGAGASFNRSTVENMPTIDRSIYDVVKLTPQANVNKSGGISIAGANNRYNSFQIDGAVANDTFGLAASGTNGGQTGTNPISMDAIEEVQVVIAPFDVRQSGFTGGAINAITKSGTNQVKGTFYTHFFNQDMIGTTAGPKGTNRTKYSEELSTTYGITFGAPIVKDKAFIFVSGEYYKKEYPNVYNPIAGSYTGKTLKKEVFDEAGNSLGNIFDTNMANAMIKHYEKYYSPSDGFNESYGEHIVGTEAFNFLTRFDWNISDKHKLMVRYQFAKADKDQYGSGSSTYYFNNSSYKQSNKTNTLVAELNSRFSDKISNTFRATAVFVRDKRTTPYSGANIYIKDTYTINMGTEYSSGANSMNSDTYTIEDNLSIIKGNHNITIGTHNEIYKFDNLFQQYAFGGYTFNTVADFMATTHTSSSIYQFNYRYTDPTLTGGEPLWAAKTYAAQFGIYAQDEWKPNRNFSLTYGLRVDLPALLNNPTSNDVFNSRTGMTPALAQRLDEYESYVGKVPNVTPLFSPRVGFRWFLNDSHKTLLRGGAGLFTGRVPFVWLSNAYNNTGMEAKSITVNSPSTAAGFPLTSNPFEKIVETGLAAAGGTATINTISKKFKYPQVFRLNLGLDHEFDNGLKLTFDALYSKTFNNVYFKNLAIESNNKVYGVNSSVGANNPNSVAPYYTLDRSYYAIVDLANTNKGYSYSLSLMAQKSFAFGLDLMASYTYGHSYSVNDGTSSVAYSNWKYNYAVDSNTPELSYSLFDKPHKIMAMVSYKTPMYLGGLQTSFTLTYTGQSGQRYSYTMDESKDFNGDGQRGNSLMYIPTADELQQMNFVDPNDRNRFEAFIQNDSYLNRNRGGWSARYAGKAPFEHHFDLHIAQDFFYDKKSGRKLQFIVDLINFSNMLNRNWGIYNTSYYNLMILQVSKLTADSNGNMTPTYQFTPQEIKLDDFNSRWRCQLGFRLVF